MKPDQRPLKPWVREYWDLRAPDFDDGDSRVSLHPSVYEEWRRLFADLLGAAPKRVLDVGAGTGELVLLFASLGHRAEGVDISPGMVEVATAKARRLGAAVEFRVGDADDLPFAEATFDVIHARHLLWTLPDPCAALRRWMRLLAPGGLLIVAESVADGATEKTRNPVRLLSRALRKRFSSKGRAKRKVGYPGTDRLPFSKGLSRDRLLGLLSEAGFSAIGCRDVLGLRQRARSALPWFRRWLNQEKSEYHLAYGRRP